jgi:hypothetical protein
MYFNMGPVPAGGKTSMEMAGENQKAPLMRG